MGKKRRITKGGIVYHVMNRAIGKARIFNKDLDFVAFENILAEGIERFSMRVCGYCIMSNHWHMLLWPPEDDTLPRFMHWITLTHSHRWHANHGTTGIGHLYKGRYKSFPIQSNSRYLNVMRYIEANPLRAGMVESAEDWQWSSFIQRDDTEIRSAKPFAIDPGPLPVPKSWSKIVNKVVPKEDYAQLTNCINRGCPYGDKDWVIKTAEELCLQSTLRKNGRPIKLKNGP